MIVKVCGVRTAEVADAAVDAGADWIGVVFVPRSVRNAEGAEAHAVVDAVARRADVVGVLLEPTAAECDEVADRFGLAAVQVHGPVQPSLAAECRVPVIRGLNVASAQAAFQLDWWPDGLLLLDAAPDAADALPGGTGRRLDAGVAADVARHRRIILAGGLGPDNVAEAIHEVLPHGVDASSGLESSPGVKDVDRVVRYVRAARLAYASLAGAAP